MKSMFQSLRRDVHCRITCVCVCVCVCSASASHLHVWGLCPHLRLCRLQAKGKTLKQIQPWQHYTHLLVLVLRVHLLLHTLSLILFPSLYQHSV